MPPSKIKSNVVSHDCLGIDDDRVHQPIPFLTPPPGLWSNGSKKTLYLRNIGFAGADVGERCLDIIPVDISLRVIAQFLSKLGEVSK